MKKLFYGLGAIAATVAPVVAVISCGNETKQSTVTATDKPTGPQAVTIDNTPNK